MVAGSFTAICELSAARSLLAPFSMTHTDGCYGQSAHTLAALTGAHITTARRWRGGRMPAPIRRLLSILFERDLGVFAPAWRGWSISPSGVLVSPERWEFTPGEVRVSRLLARHLPAPAGPPLPPPVGSVFDWIEGEWRQVNVISEPPLWAAIEAAARAQRTPYPRAAQTR